jgi:hypothetical protein
VTLAKRLSLSVVFGYFLSKDLRFGLTSGLILEKASQLLVIRALHELC